MEHLNYCRQMVRQFSNTLSMPGLPEESRRILRLAIDLAQQSQKFMLPEGGRLYDDPEYRALDDSEPLRLPYPFIALEYPRRGDSPLKAGEVLSTKAILFACEVDNAIILKPVVWSDRKGRWAPFPLVVLSNTGYLDRTTITEGYTAIRIWRPDSRFDSSDYQDEVGALLCFLNALQCMNVHVERSAPKKIGKMKKATLPFDTYHILTISVPGKDKKATASIGGHRSPREHLRRGHIRRLADGRRIWVNATVVAAGRGAGLVKKDYALNGG
jgi:hypothetical protein